MKAKDIMTKNVISISPRTSINEIAKLLLARHVSAVPVVDESNNLLGIVSEGDLMRRAELGTQRQRSWWLNLVGDSDNASIQEFIRSHGRRAEDVMTREIITVTEDTEAGEIARLLESRRVKRVPVMRDGKVVGIVSRANLIQELAAGHVDSTPADDETIKVAIDELNKSEGWMTHGNLNATVRDGCVEVWGWADSDVERRAITLAVNSIPGVKSVESHLGLIAPYLRGT